MNTRKAVIKESGVVISQDLSYSVLRLKKLDDIRLKRTHCDKFLTNIFSPLNLITFSTSDDIFSMVFTSSDATF